MKMKKTLFFLLPVIFLCSCQRTYKVPDEENSNTAKKEIAVESGEKSDEKNSEGSKISFAATLIRIIDGDTAEVLYGELPLKIRLQHIDAPEKRGNQPYGNKAKTILSQLCFGQEVTILTDGDFDMGGHLVAEIFNAEGLNVNKEMVRLGYAWHFKKYSDDMSYDDLEKEARKLNIGLWQDSNPVAPWDFR